MDPVRLIIVAEEKRAGCSVELNLPVSRLFAVTRDASMENMGGGEPEPAACSWRFVLISFTKVQKHSPGCYGVTCPPK